MRVTIIPSFGSIWLFNSATVVSSGILVIYPSSTVYKSDVISVIRFLTFNSNEAAFAVISITKVVELQ